MRRVFPIIVIAGAALLVVFALKVFFPSKDGGPGGPGGFGGGMPPATVDVVTVHAQALPSSFETVGSLRAQESVSLKPEVAGKIEGIRFIEGDRVGRGQVLFQLDAALL